MLAVLKWFPGFIRRLISPQRRFTLLVSKRWSISLSCFYKTPGYLFNIDPRLPALRRRWERWSPSSTSISLSKSSSQNYEMTPQIILGRILLWKVRKSHIISSFRSGEEVLSTFNTTINEKILEKLPKLFKKIPSMRLEIVEESVKLQTISNRILCNIIYTNIEKDILSTFFRILRHPRLPILLVKSHTLTKEQKSFWESKAYYLMKIFLQELKTDLDLVASMWTQPSIKELNAMSFWNYFIDAAIFLSLWLLKLPFCDKQLLHDIVSIPGMTANPDMVLPHWFFTRLTLGTTFRFLTQYSSQQMRQYRGRVVHYWLSHPIINL